MEQFRSIINQYRIPDFSKLWRPKSGEDETDSKNESLIVNFESIFVNLQEVCLWTNPSRSIAAIFTVQIMYYYLSATSNTFLNLTAWTILLCFIYSTWIYRIWPEIKVPTPEEDDQTTDSECFTPINPDVLSGPELKNLVGSLNKSIERVFKYRKEKPAAFCAFGCTFFAILAYIGSYVSVLGLFYVVTNSCLILPTLLKSFNPDLTQQILDCARKDTSVEEEDSYLPPDSKDNLKILEVPTTQDRSISEVLRESLESTTNSFLNGLDDIPSHDEIDKPVVDEDFLPATPRTLAEAIEDDGDYSDDFSLENSKDARYLVDESNIDEDSVDEDFEMITDNDLNQLS